MPFISINESPLMPGVTPVKIHYREFGNGTPLIFLHGGWGYEVYPFDSQIEAFSDQFRILIPDRSGYGRSMRIGPLPADFHSRAAAEMMSFLDALNIERAFLWGHSDGAVIATMMGLAWPGRFFGIILEAFHLYRMKPGSREFFETMAHNPDMLGERVCAALARDHGEDYFRELIVNNGRAWLRIAEESNHPKQDLYAERLGELAVPTLFIHGSVDPRTEPDELDSVRQRFDSARVHSIESGGHSPHSQKSTASECNQVAGDFLRQITGF